MSTGGALTYRCDGSLPGLLCCIFDSYTRRELPAGILMDDSPTLFPVREIVTDDTRALRVWRSILRQGGEAPGWVRDCWLAQRADCGDLLFCFIRRLYQEGPAVCRRFDDPEISAVFKTVQAVRNEAHLTKEFLRFSERQGILVSEIGPKAMVLPLIGSHFADRFALETFLIYDQTHQQALFYQNHTMTIRTVEELILKPETAEEQAIEALWKRYYATISIEERYNPLCRRTHMPKHFWRYALELKGELLADERKRIDEKSNHKNSQILPDPGNRAACTVSHHSPCNDPFCTGSEVSGGQQTCQQTDAGNHGRQRFRLDEPDRKGTTL